jgi:hypothetical protein
LWGGVGSKVCLLFAVAALLLFVLVQLLSL